MKRAENKLLPERESVIAFIEIAATGSLTQAADKLETSKSTLSRRIKNIEQQIGQPLLRRESNKLSLTPAGISFLDYCYTLLQLADAQQKTFETFTNEVSGILHIATHNAFIRGWFSQQLDVFIQAHPKLRLSLRTCQQPVQNQQLEEVILWLGIPIENGLKRQRLGRLTQGIYAASNYLEHNPIEKPEDLLHHKWIDFLGGHKGGVTLHNHHLESVVVPIGDSQIRTDQLIMQADAIVRGNGVGIFPDWMAKLRNRAHPNCMVRCLDGWNGDDMDVWLMYPYGHLSQRTTAFVQHLISHIPIDWTT